MGFAPAMCLEDVIEDVVELCRKGDYGCIVTLIMRVVGKVEFQWCL